VIQLAFNYAAKPKIACRLLTPEQMMAPAEHAPALSIARASAGRCTSSSSANGSIVYRGMHAPTGLWNDGPSSALERFAVPQGRQMLVAGCATAASQQAFDYERSIAVDLSPQQNRDRIPRRPGLRVPGATTSVIEWREEFSVGRLRSTTNTRS
jgi:hypothetical protein